MSEIGFFFTSFAEAMFLYAFLSYVGTQTFAISIAESACFKLRTLSSFEVDEMPTYLARKIAY